MTEFGDAGDVCVVAIEHYSRTWTQCLSATLVQRGICSYLSYDTQRAGMREWELAGKLSFSASNIKL